MKVLIFGGSGKVGRLTVEKLLKAGHRVTVFVHQSSPSESSDNLAIVKGDVHALDAVAQAVKGHDAVISTLGSWGTPTKDILSTAMRGVIPAMQSEGVTRIVTLTGSGALLPNEPQTTAGAIAHKIFSIIAGDIVRDGEEHLRLLQESKLDWTSLRAPVMRNDNGRYALNNKLPAFYERVSRDAVAQALVDQLTSTDFVQQAPHIHPA